MLVMDADHQGTDEDDTCGLHAIANALSLALGKDPTIISYDEGAMRQHLFNCLEEGFLTMFPHRDRTSDHPNGIKQRCILKVFCSCKRPEYGFYFQCTGCRVWFHPECEDMSKEDIPEEEDAPVYCKGCTKG